MIATIDSGAELDGGEKKRSSLSCAHKASHTKPASAAVENA
jgi:hypothetical protein